MLNPADYLKSGYTIENNIVKDSNGKKYIKIWGHIITGRQDVNLK